MAVSGQQIGAIFTAQRKKLGLTEGELSRRSGVKQPTVHRILSGSSESPRIDNIERISRVLGVEVAPLLSGKLAEESGAYISNLGAGPSIKGRVPVVSWVQAGALCEAIDLYSPGVAEDWLDCPFPHSPLAFCLVVKGLSMYPEYRPDEVILVEPELCAEHGDDIVARTPEGTATFKRLQKTEDGNYLLAINPDYPDRIIQIPDGTIICGVVTGSWIKRRRR